MLARLLAAQRWHPVVVALVAAAIALPMLGWSGLSLSEGHRAIPAWAMLERGDFLRVELFEATYIRKPPGMAWAITATSAVLGETELAARLPSALGFIGMALVAWWFGRRWFGGGETGHPAGLAAGLAQALTPAMWPWARSAEIEGLHAAMTQIAALVVIDLCRPGMLRGSTGSTSIATHNGTESEASRPVLVPGLALGLAMTAMVALKGPSGLPVLAAALVGAVIAWRSWRVVRSSVLALGVLVALAITIPGAWLFARANAGTDAITQDAGGFLWDTTRLSSIALLAPTALAAALPGSLACLLVWGADSRRERHDPALPPATREGATIARALAFAFLACIAMYVLAGVSNHRYLLPAMGLLPPLAAYAARGAAGGVSGAGPFNSTRRSLARILCIGHPVVLVCVLVVAAAVSVPLQERSRARNSARGAGESLGAALPKDALVFSNGAVDARPEVGHALRRACAGVVRWDRALVLAGALPTPGAYLLLRGDAASEEMPRYREAIERGELTEVARATAHKFEFVLLRVEP